MSKNLKGKTRPASNPYETYVSGDWTWKVLKHYQAPEAEYANPYARVFCLVVTPMTGELGDMGDTYIRDIPGARAQLALELGKGNDRPVSGRQYRLTGSGPSIANGDSWADSEVKE